MKDTLSPQLRQALEIMVHANKYTMVPLSGYPPSSAEFYWHEAAVGLFKLLNETEQSERPAGCVRPHGLETVCGPTCRTDQPWREHPGNHDTLQALDEPCGFVRNGQCCRQPKDSEDHICRGGHPPQMGCHQFVPVEEKKREVVTDEMVERALYQWTAGGPAGFDANVWENEKQWMRRALEAAFNV